MSCGCLDRKCVPLSDSLNFASEEKILRHVGDFILREMGRISVGVEHDNEGKSEANVTYSDETEDGSIKWEAEIDYSREGDGSNNVKVGVKATWDF